MSIFLENAGYWKMVKELEIEDFLNSEEIPRNLKNRLNSAILRDCGQEGFDPFELH